MTLWHGYLAIENLGLNPAQKDALVDRLRGIGQKNGGKANERMQWRPRLDNQAVIFEAVFDDAQLTPASVKQFLASIFGVQASSITHVVGTASFGNGTTQYATFTRTGVDYLRVAIFGGVTSTWEESRLEEHAYRLLHLADWEPEGN